MSKQVLIFIDYFYPGFKAGGPSRTIMNLTSHLGKELEFFIVTSDKDLGDASPYTGIVINQWADQENYKIFYVSSNSILNVLRIIRASKINTVYLNSLFSTKFTIKVLLLRSFGLTRQKTLIIAPRGELSAGALSIKSLKKRLFLRVGNAIGIFEGIRWHVSSIHEANDVIKHIQSKGHDIHIAQNLPRLDKGLRVKKRGEIKDLNTLKLVHIGRISSMKNLDYALEVIKEAGHSLKSGQKIELYIYGPIEDIEYWRRCQAIISSMNDNTQAIYAGEVNSEKVVEVLSNYDALFLPTKGENFGHVIVEALTAGLPVLISDQTPWRNLSSINIGWDLPLENKKAFSMAIIELLNMDSSTYQAIKDSVQSYSASRFLNSTILSDNRKLFDVVDH